MSERPRTLAVTEPELWTPREWRRHRVPWGPDGATLCAELHGEIVGALFVRRGVRTVNRHAAEFGLNVAARARGAGVGTALIRSAEEWAREHDVTRMTLSVFEHNEVARRLYRTLGYQEEGVERGGVRFPDAIIDVVRMFKMLDEGTLADRRAGDYHENAPERHGG